MKDHRGVEMKVGHRVVWCTQDRSGPYLRTGRVICVGVEKQFVVCTPDDEGKNVTLAIPNRIVVID